MGHLGQNVAFRERGKTMESDENKLQFKVFTGSVVCSFQSSRNVSVSSSFHGCRGAYMAVCELFIRPE